MKKDISKCNCKTGCKTSHCSYKKVSAKCSSQCHKGLKCKNYDKDRPYDKNMSLSKWGGSCDFNKVKCVFVNTCPVDSWLVLFCSLSYENPEVQQNFIKKILELVVILLQFWDWHRNVNSKWPSTNQRKYVILTCKKEHIIFMGTSTHYLQNI